MLLIPLQNKTLPAKLRRSPIIAVDVGFSASDAAQSKGQTCGFATNATGYTPVRPGTQQHNGIWSENLTFSQAVASAESVLRTEAAEKGATLILEAPLSAYFDANGNPASRDHAEDDIPWYRSAGAVTALSASFMLRELCGRLHQKKITCHLIEGFVTGAASGNHRVVASRLVQYAGAGEPIELWQGSLMPALEPFTGGNRDAPGVIRPE